MTIDFTLGELVALNYAANFGLKRWPYPIAFNGELEAARDKIALAINASEFDENDWSKPLIQTKSKTASGLNSCCN